jgi:predicted enzyme related to lactoylglutathione lyase
MAKVLGIGGVFFKSPDPARLSRWYEQWLGLTLEAGGPFAVFQPGQMPPSGYVVWSAFDAATEYFSPSDRAFMIILVVDELEQALAQVRSGGAQIIGDVGRNQYGEFGWFLDPDGNKVELWKPPASPRASADDLEESPERV